MSGESGFGTLRNDKFLHLTQFDVKARVVVGVLCVNINHHGIMKLVNCCLMRNTRRPAVDIGMSLFVYNSSFTRLIQLNDNKLSSHYSPEREC